MTEDLKRKDSYQTNIIEWWRVYKQQVKKLHIRYSKLHKQENLDEKKKLEIDLKLAEINLRLDPYNSRYRTNYQNTKNKLRAFTLKKN